MKPEIASLADLISYMETSLDIEGFRAYFDQQTARIVVIEESVLKAAQKAATEPAGKADDPDDEEIKTAKEIVNDQAGRFLQPPDKSQFDEQHYKTQFIGTISDAEIAEKLERTLKAKGTFNLFQTSFSSVLSRSGLEEQWNQYLTEARKQFVIEWAQKNNLPYKDDLPAGKAGSTSV